MIKKLTLLAAISLMVFSCSVSEHPEFIGIENLKVIDKNFKTFTLRADAHFKNLNHVGGTLKTDDLKIYINNIEVATIVTESFDVPVKDDFTVPLTVKISTDKIINKNSISGLLNSIKTKTLEVNYKGVIDYSLSGFSYDYNVDYSETVKL